MEDFNLEYIDAIIKEGKKVLEKNNATDLGMLSITLHKNIYNLLKPEEWVDYIRKHNYSVLIKFIDDEKLYKLNIDGKLERVKETYKYE